MDPQGVFSDGGNKGTIEGSDSTNGRQINFNGSHDHTVDINSGSTDNKGINAAGGDSPSQTGTNANLPPYYALVYMIKT